MSRSMWALTLSDGRPVTGSNFVLDVALPIVRVIGSWVVSPLLPASMLPFVFSGSKASCILATLEPQ